MLWLGEQIRNGNFRVSPWIEKRSGCDTKATMGQCPEFVGSTLARLRTILRNKLVGSGIAFFASVAFSRDPVLARQALIVSGTQLWINPCDTLFIFQPQSSYPSC